MGFCVTDAVCLLFGYHSRERKIAYRGFELLFIMPVVICVICPWCRVAAGFASMSKEHFEAEVLQQELAHSQQGRLRKVVMTGVGIDARLGPTRE